jgi:hypothetical protein
MMASWCPLKRDVHCSSTQTSASMPEDTASTLLFPPVLSTKLPHYMLLTPAVSTLARVKGRMPMLRVSEGPWCSCPERVHPATNALLCCHLGKGRWVLGPPLPGVQGAVRIAPVFKGMVSGPSQAGMGRRSSFLKPTTMCSVTLGCGCTASSSFCGCRCGRTGWGNAGRCPRPPWGVYPRPPWGSMWPRPPCREPAVRSVVCCRAATCSEVHMVELPCKAGWSTTGC